MSFSYAAAVDLAVIRAIRCKSYQLVLLLAVIDVGPETEAGCIFGQVQERWQASQSAHAVHGIATNEVKVASFHFRECFLKNYRPKGLICIAVEGKSQSIKVVQVEHSVINNDKSRLSANVEINSVYSCLILGRSLKQAEDKIGVLGDR